jgi:hypothetical protein
MKLKKVKMIIVLLSITSRFCGTKLSKVLEEFCIRIAV